MCVCVCLHSDTTLNKTGTAEIYYFMIIVVE